MKSLRHLAACLRERSTDCVAARVDAAQHFNAVPAGGAFKRRGVIILARGAAISWDGRTGFGIAEHWHAVKL